MVERTVKFAILIPAYNCERTIAATLSSLQEIAAGWEHVDSVIVCDDSSSDCTVSTINATKFDRCRLVLLRHEKNQGEARCYCTMLASLPPEVTWFLILHSDDLALNCFIARNLELVSRCPPNVATVSSNYFVFDDTSEELAHQPSEDVIVFRGASHSDIQHTARVGTWWHISGALVNRALWEKFGGRDPTLPQAGDWDLTLRWQSHNYVVGHSLLPTTKCRKGVVESVSSQSYLQFRDLKEKTRIIFKHRKVFGIRLRTVMSLILAEQATRRIVKLILIGKFRNAGAGFWITIRCLAALLGITPSYP